MSNDLMNWHCQIGRPYGDDATLDDVSEAIGAELISGLWVPRSALDHEQQIKSDLFEALVKQVSGLSTIGKGHLVCQESIIAIAKARGEK